MFDRLFGHLRPLPKSLPEPDARSALGALLVRVALADQNYQVSEVAQIDRVLSETFNLKPLEAAKLRATCEALERKAPGTPEFARILREEVAYAERKALAQAMWSVVLADGEIDAKEELLQRQIEIALGLDEKDTAAARRTPS